MKAFIRYNIKSLFSLTYLFTVIVYSSFAWFISAPPFSFNAVYMSQRIIDSYNFVLMSIAFLTFLLFVVAHFREALQTGKKEIPLSRLTKRKIFWGLVFSYLLFFFLGYVIPSYIVALVQQLVYAPKKIDLLVYLINSLNLFTGYSFFWIILTLILFAWFKNDFVVLFVILITYGLASFLSLYTQGVLFNNYWLSSLLSKNPPERIAQSILVWAVFMTSIIISSIFISKKILDIDLSDPFKKGLFVRLLDKFRLDLSMHHLKMMGLGSQKILAFFTLLGLSQIIVLLSMPNANLLPFAKIYIGAFLPILFSFNQYYIVSIDREAGMIHNNFLRRMCYRRIVLNRWLVLLIPQLLISLIFLIIFSVFGKALPVSFIFYVLLLNIFCSAFNLFLGVLTNKTGVANLILLFFIYVQLREDFQNIFSANSIISDFNIFSPLLRLENSSIGYQQFIIVLSTILFSLYLSYKSLHKVLK